MEQEEDGGGAACGLCRETGRCADLKYITAVPASAGLAVGTVRYLRHTQSGLGRAVRSPKEEQEAFAETINYPVRKAAHATEYAVLGILVLVRCKYQKKWTRKCMILTAWGISTMYAATDEIHQLFVPGRACMVTDVMIDSAGALTGILFASALAAIIIGRNREQKHQK